jgi:hypothetical protein
VFWKYWPAVMLALLQGHLFAEKALPSPHCGVSARQLSYPTAVLRSSALFFAGISGESFCLKISTEYD